MKKNLFRTSLFGVLAAAAACAQSSNPLDGSAAASQNAGKWVVPRYTVTDLGPTGNPFSQATSLNNAGVVGGLSTAPDGAQHALFWFNRQAFDIGTPGLGGPNSGVFGINERGQAMVGAETSSKDPNNENFCGYGTGLQCLAAVWQNGKITPLPTLGGTNAGVGMINNGGQIAGWAENATRDPDCPSKVALNGTGPQVLDFEAVIWGPKPGQIRELFPLHGDSVGMALGINENGQAVGTSGLCSNTVLPGFVVGPHAVLWDKDGSVHDLGSLGGTSNPAILAVGNVAFSINNRGQVVGTSAMPGSTRNHPFLWTRETGMQDLGLLNGDVVGAGLAINNRGDVVGASIGPPGAMGGDPRAVLWRNGQKNDLNALSQADSPFVALLTAFAINDSAQIAGFGVTTAGDIHGFLATPNTGTSENDEATDQNVKIPAVPPDSARKLLLGRFGIHVR